MCIAVEVYLRDFIELISYDQCQTKSFQMNTLLLAIQVLYHLPFVTLVKRFGCVKQKQIGCTLKMLNP